MFKVNNRNFRTSHWRRSGVFIVKFELIPHLFLKFEQLNVGWEAISTIAFHQMFFQMNLKLLKLSQFLSIKTPMFKLIIGKLVC